MDPKQLLIIFFLVSGLCDGHYNCLTWTSDCTDISLICRINNFSMPVSFTGPSGKEQAKCTFNSSLTNCQSHYKNGSIRADDKKQQVVFIRNINKLSVNGEWACIEGIHRFTTEVSTERGLLESTDLHIIGHIESANKLRLKCFSCREPQWKSAEFLMNNITVDSIRYIPESMQCFHSKGKCNANTCSCSKSGNEFTRIFQVNIHRRNLTFSCKMKFIDNIVSQRFLKIATVTFNGTDFTKQPTVTEITTVARSNKTKDGNRNETGTIVLSTPTDVRTYLLPVTLIVAGIFITVILTTGIKIFVCQYKFRRRSKDEVEKFSEDLLLEENFGKDKENSGDRRCFDLGQEMHEVLKEDDLDSKLKQQSQVALEKKGPASIKIILEFDKKYLRGHLISGIAVTEDGIVLLCDCRNANILIFDKMGKYLDTILVTYKPWDIDAVPGAKMAVTSCKTDHFIQCINTHSRNKEWSKTLKESAGGGIACSTKYIFVGSINRIFVLNHMGIHIRDIWKLVNRDILIRYLSFRDDQFYYTGYGLNCVICIDEEDLESFQVKSADLDTPMKVALDKEGIMYCLGGGSDNIVRFTDTGEFLDIPLTENNGLNCPWTLCFSHDYKYLYISNHNGTSVLLCQLLHAKP